MPGLYAHYRFGQEAVAAMTPQQRQRASRFRQLYEMGLYGVELFSYAAPLGSGEFLEIQKTYQGKTPEQWLLATKDWEKTEADWAYLSGVLAHSCLEAACESYLRRLPPETSRAAVETAFDAYLMAQEGTAYPGALSAHMGLTRGECVTISRFYPPATAAQIHGAVRRMAWFYRLLAQKSRGNRLLLPLLGGRDWKDRLPPEERPTVPTRSDSEFLARYTRATKSLPQLFQSLQEI